MARGRVTRSRTGGNESDTKPVWVRLGGMWKTKKEDTFSINLKYYEGKKGNRLEDKQMETLENNLFDTEGDGIHLLVVTNDNKERGSKMPDFNILIDAEQIDTGD